MNHEHGPPPGTRPDEGRGYGGRAAPRLWGRDAPLQSLLSVLLGLDDEASPGALLIGEGGMGKSSLLRMLDSSVPGILHAHARLGDRLVPYAMLERWVRRWLDRLPPEAREDASALLGPLLKPPASISSSSTDSLPDPAAVHRLMLSASPDVAAWALDDLHLADDASAEWLLRFLQQSPPTALPWVISSQPPEPGSMAEAVLEAIAGLAGVRSVLLGPLNRSDIFEWVTDACSVPIGATRADNAVKRLMQATKGVPLHLQLLIEEGERHALFTGTLSPSPDEPLPTLNAALGARLAQLPASALSVLRAAAVAGQDYGEEAVCDFTGLTAEELASAHQTLQAHGLWRGGDFTHNRVREAARMACTEAMAKSLHAHWAAWLETHAGMPGRIAAHWQAAGQPVRALQALQDAARHAQRLNCMPERIACLMRAAAIAEEHSQVDLAFDCSCEAFEAHTESIRHTDGDALLAQMRRLAHTPRQQARAATQAAWHAMVHGHLESAIEHGEHAVRLAEDENDEDLLGPARQQLGTALGVAGQLSRALTLLQEAQAWAQTHLPADELASFEGNLAALLDNLGQAEQARRHHLSALALTAQHAEGTHRATLLANYAMSRLEAGDPLGARELALKAQHLVEVQDAESSTAGFIAVLMAPCERTLAKYSEALDWCDRAERILSTRNASRAPVAQLQRAHVWLDLGLHERALELLAGPGLPLGRQLPPRHAVRWLLLLARAQARQGLDTAHALQEAISRLPSEGWPELRLLLRAEQALLLPGIEAAAALSAIANTAQQQNLHSVALGAWLQSALLASAGARELDLARTAAGAALALMVKGVETPHVDRALRWLAPARALAACGETVRARGLIVRGQQWLASTAEEQVPPWARQSFLDLHPLNLLLREAPVAPA